VEILSCENINRGPNFTFNDKLMILQWNRQKITCQDEARCIRFCSLIHSIWELRRDTLSRLKNIRSFKYAYYF